jgi:hypothetical protein
VLQLLAGIAVVTGTFLWARASPGFDLYRFPLAWAGVLLALDGGSRLWRGKSPLPRPGDWLACGLASVVFWDVFELVNLRLEDWWYTGVSPSPAASGLFGALSFSTVLPAVRLLVGDAPFPPAARRPLRLAAGVAMLALALAFPAVAFPLAWIFLWPVCEALAGVRVPLRLAAFGLPLGLLWESLNYGCRRGWVYTVPRFEHPKLFEMPLAGYLGYLPFLLEAAAALALLDKLRPHLRAPVIAAVIAFHFAVDHFARPRTDVSFAPYDERGVDASVLALERRTHMGLPRARRVAQEGWGALDQDPPALVRVWIEKANSR